jgi:hypothetical protein
MCQSLEEQCPQAGLCRLRSAMCGGGIRGTASRKGRTDKNQFGHLLTV